MSSRAKGRKDKHNGRSEAERSSNLVPDAELSIAERKRRRDEEEYWASLAGPVTVTHKEPRKP